MVQWWHNEIGRYSLNLDFSWKRFQDFKWHTSHMIEVVTLSAFFFNFIRHAKIWTSPGECMSLTKAYLEPWQTSMMEFHHKCSTRFYMSFRHSPVHFTVAWLLQYVSFCLIFYSFHGGLVGMWKPCRLIFRTLDSL